MVCSVLEADPGDWEIDRITHVGAEVGESGLSIPGQKEWEL